MTLVIIHSFLSVGVCVEALSSQRSAEPIQSVHYCLQAVHTLLDSPWPRSRLSADPSLAIELLNVMHRLLLTRETLSTHLLVTAVVKQVILAMQERLAAATQDMGRQRPWRRFAPASLGKG